jgi:hypothetical protein
MAGPGHPDKKGTPLTLADARDEPRRDEADC